MGFVVKINALDHTDIEGYYTGKIIFYKDEEVNIPSIVDEKNDTKVKIYKRYKNAVNAMNKILEKSSYVSSCTVEDYCTI